MDKEPLGFAGEASTERSPSGKQCTLHLAAIMEACKVWGQGRVQTDLTARRASRFGSSGWELAVDPAVATA